MRIIPHALPNAIHAMNTEKAIEDLAAAFCKLSQPEHKSMYMCALEALVCLSKAEKATEILAELKSHPEESAWQAVLQGSGHNRIFH